MFKTNTDAVFAWKLLNVIVLPRGLQVQLYPPPELAKSLILATSGATAETLWRNITAILPGDATNVTWKVDVADGQGYKIRVLDIDISPLAPRAGRLRTSVSPDFSVYTGSSSPPGIIKNVAVTSLLRGVTTATVIFSIQFVALICLALLAIVSGVGVF